MPPQKISRLYDKNTSVAFYEDRYSQGYMEECSHEKRQKIHNLVKDLELPDTGEAIDFGCGNGVLTDLLREALPTKWRVFGTDISSVAIENARRLYPSCTFFVEGEKEFARKKFDFLFSHHVLEHIYDVSKVLNEIHSVLKPDSAMLHILPCGNKGSLEQRICNLRYDGVNPELGNRFFFEDEGHVRRMTSGQLEKLFAPMGFTLAKEFFGNQYFGAIDWITQSPPGFLQAFLDTSKAINQEARKKIEKLKFILWAIWILRYPAVFVESKFFKKNKTLKDLIFLILSLALYIFTKPMNLLIKQKAGKEWDDKKTEPNGSEMYLFFKR